MMDAAHPNPEIAARLQNIYALHRKTIDLRLDRSPYADLLERLGNPQHRLPPVVHVAGTNGKGSTLAFLRAMLEAAGYRVHVYTSPHLIRFNERITLAGATIDDDLLLRSLARIDTVNGGLPVTFFEYTTALALDLFAAHPADICLLETGLGGRLDCTNVVTKPICTAITNIGFDHMQFLGDTIAEIAGEKAGIMKSGTPCVIAPQDFMDVVKPVFRRHAMEKGVMLHYAVSCAADKELSLIGAHQRDNAGTALEILEILRFNGFCFGDDAVEQGLRNAQWAGRLQCLDGHGHEGDGTFAQVLRGHIAELARPAQQAGGSFGANFTVRDVTLWYDGGHNEGAAGILATQLSHWKAEQPHRPIFLVFGMQHDKDPNGFLRPLLPYLNGIVLVDLDGGMHPQKAAALLRKLEPCFAEKAHIFEEKSVLDADAARSKADASGNPEILALACGSLYLYQILVR